MIASKLVNVKTIYFQHKKLADRDDKNFDAYLALPQWLILHFDSIAQSQLKHNNNNSNDNNNSANNTQIKLSNIKCCAIDTSTKNQITNMTSLPTTVAPSIKKISIDCSRDEWIPTPLFITQSITNTRCSSVMDIAVTFNRHTNIRETIKSLFSNIRYPNLNKITLRGEIDFDHYEQVFSAIQTNIFAHYKSIVKDTINTDNNISNKRKDNHSNENVTNYKFENRFPLLNEIEINVKVDACDIFEIYGYRCKYLCALEKNFASLFEQLLKMIETDNYNHNVKYRVNIYLQGAQPCDNECVAFASDFIRCGLVLMNMIRQWIGGKFSHVKNNYACSFKQEQMYNDGEILGLSLSPL